LFKLILILYCFHDNAHVLIKKHVPRKNNFDTVVVWLYTKIYNGKFFLSLKND